MSKTERRMIKRRMSKRDEQKRKQEVRKIEGDEHLRAKETESSAEANTKL